MTDQGRHSYRFKTFRLEVEERQLLRRDHAVPLTPKAFDVLVALVERSGHLVEKDELMRLVWSDSFVEEANIARLVHTLRKALGEKGNGSKFIETVPKKGYRFVAEVSESGKSAPQIPKNGQYPPPSKNQLVSRRARSTPADDAQQIAPLSSPLPEKIVAPETDSIGVPRVLIFAAGFVSAILLLFFLLVEVSVDSVANLPPRKDKSLAVLPLRPTDAAGRDALYEIGIADSIINRLSGLPGLDIRPLSATRKYAGGAHDPLAAGKEQQVDFVLASSYRLTDGKIRITAQLLNVATGQNEGTFRSEKDTTEVSAAQTAVADEIGSLLQKRLASVSLNRPANSAPNGSP